MSAPIKVAIVGATGRTGNVIVDGLLASETKFEVTALTRASSINSEANQALAKRGVNIVLADLLGPKPELVKVLAGIDVVISCIIFDRMNDQIPLAEAAKAAGVKRFVPNFWATPAARGVMTMYDQKLDILAAVQRLGLPYTTIDVGWWSQQMIPAIPSGRTDHAVFKLFTSIPGDGTTPIGIMDCRDIGRFTAKIIADPRTLNKQVFAYTEVLTFNQILDLVSKVSGGEKAEIPFTSAEQIEEILRNARESLKTNPNDMKAIGALLIYEYLYSWGVRGDDTPEVAEYLGYVDGKALYPDLKTKTMEELLTEVLDGKPSGYVDPANFNFDDYM